MLKQLKHTLLKTINITALGFLEPYVRLAWGEEPTQQVRKIVQFTVVPALAIVAALLTWAYLISPNIKTRAGELPSPRVVMQAAGNLHVFAEREDAKSLAYLTAGQDRERWLQETQAELEAIAPRQAAADEAVAAARALELAHKDSQVAPHRAKLDAMKSKLAADKARREADLKQSALDSATPAEREALVAGLVELDMKLDHERKAIAALEERIKRINDEKHPAVVAALAEQTAVAEHKQYLETLTTLLTSNNRQTRSEEARVKLDQARQHLASAEPDAAYAAARRVLSAEGQLEKAEASSFAQAPTLYYQIRRSILCVFFGFVLGSMIAIPVGVLCGLSKVFMGAMTPFIAVFKPVSPIVWLPIALIIASALIPDPDKHWLTQWLWSLPVLGEYKINPAFFAAAATVALCSLWATMVNTALGVASVDKDHLNVAKVLRLGFWPRLFKIVLPSSLPLVFAGLRISLGVGWMVLIAAELLSTSEGIGKFVWDQFQNGASDSFAKMFVVVFVVGIIGLVLDRIMVVFQRLVSFEGSVAAV